ncbi:MAG: phage terminase large subunit family protein [Oscillospiraceae bacterium]
MKAISRGLAGMQPPENLTVTEWAECKRYLSTEASAEPGLWRTSRTPYLRAIMDAFTDPKIRHIVFVAASQVGKTEVINNIIGYIIDQNPGSILFVHPTTIDAREFSKLRIAPMIRDSPAVRRRISAPKSRDSGNTLLQKTYPGGILTLGGANEAHARASNPIRYVFADERDRWAQSAGTEGDPWELAMARQTTFYNAKAVEVSTPTIRGSSNIAKSFAKGTMERWKSQCPHCGEFHEIQWKDIRYKAEETVVNHERTYTVHDVFWICPGCGCVSEEATMKKQPAKWVAENPAAYANGVRSFWLNAFVSPWASWESICLKYQNALGDTGKMQVVYNTCFGQLWEDRGDTQDPDTLLGRREVYEAELPEGVLVLTAGVDTQDDRMEYEIVGHGHFGETWGIEKGIIMGRPDDPATWDSLDMMVFDRVLRFKDGLGLKVSMSFVDEGGHFTEWVRQFCRNRVGKKVFCIKGFPGADRPFTSPPKKQKIIIKNRYLGTVWQYQLGVDSGKQIIMDNLKVQAPGPKYCHFPLRDDYGAMYFHGLLSEHLVPEGKVRQRWVWTKIQGHERNEPLDCRNYALAAFKVLPVDLDAVDRRLKVARGKRPTTEEPPRQAPKRRGPVKPKDTGYDDW